MRGRGSFTVRQPTLTVPITLQAAADEVIE